jgi:LPS-assembly protein
MRATWCCAAGPTGCGVVDSTIARAIPAGEITADPHHLSRLGQDGVRYCRQTAGLLTSAAACPDWPRSDFTGTSGLLVPDFRLGSSNGAPDQQHLCWRFALSGPRGHRYALYQGLPMITGRYRQ